MWAVWKKDPVRSDYRKADKLRPLIWYLVLATAYLAVTAWSLYMVCTLYVVVTDSLCHGATFTDTINLGHPDSTWVGAQDLGAQLSLFSDEASISQQSYIK